MPEILSFKQMQHHYPDEWLLIAYTELDDNLKVVCGEVSSSKAAIRSCSKKYS